MADCIFCKIANREIPSEYVYEDEKITAFKDNAPQAPEHFLIVPKRHVPSLDALTEDDAELMGWIGVKIREIAAAQGMKNGYRVVINCGEDGQQTVPHLHFHVLGGRKMSWPPG